QGASLGRRSGTGFFRLIPSRRSAISAAIVPWINTRNLAPRHCYPRGALIRAASRLSQTKDRLTMKAAGETVSSPAGVLPRQWRDVRGKTQLDLSLDAGVSQKHISFVESGRSIPSRQMLLDLAQALDVPLRERNELLMAAGYAPSYSSQALDAPLMNSISKA